MSIRAETAAAKNSITERQCSFKPGTLLRTSGDDRIINSHIEAVFAMNEFSFVNAGDDRL